MKTSRLVEAASQAASQPASQRFSLVACYYRPAAQQHRYNIVDQPPFHSNTHSDRPTIGAILRWTHTNANTGEVHLRTSPGGWPVIFVDTSKCVMGALMGACQANGERACKWIYSKSNGGEWINLLNSKPGNNIIMFLSSYSAFHLVELATILVVSSPELDDLLYIITWARLESHYLSSYELHSFSLPSEEREHGTLISLWE